MNENMAFGQNPYANFLNQTSPQYSQNYGYPQGQQQYMQQQYMQAQNTPQAQTVQPTAKSGEILKVNGLAGAKEYPTRSNSAVVLFDIEGDKFYLKTADAANFAVTKIFEYKEIKEDVAPAVVQTTDTSNFVSKDELEAFKQDIDSKISALNTTQSNNINNNNNNQNKNNNNK